MIFGAIIDSTEKIPCRKKDYMIQWGDTCEDDYKKDRRKQN